ncbi:hypothetical protein [Pseudomonas syringae]|nr:hypothetical protein [Pseudomonas syringae]
MTFNEWHEKEVLLDQLTVDTEKQLVYFYDYATHRKELEETIAPTQLRQEFHDFWLEHGTSEEPEADVTWSELRERMALAMPQISLPRSFHEGRFHGAVSVVLSARYGRPIGYRLPRLINVTNTAFDYYKAYLLPFGWTLEAFHQAELLASQDTKKTWGKRRKIIREALRSKDPAYRQDLTYNRLFAFLVPEIKDDLELGRHW